MHSFVKPGLFHRSAETTECLIFFGVKIFQKIFQMVAYFFLVAFVLAITGGPLLVRFLIVLISN